MSAAIARQDADDIRLQAHTIKGASANIGADPMMKIAQSMELAAKSGTLAGMQADFSQLENAFIAFRQAAEIYLQNRQTS